MNKDLYVSSFVELIRRASTDLPADVECKIREGYANEEADSTAQQCLGTIIKNLEMARAESLPMCQDTGTNIYFLKIPFSVKHKDVINAIEEATLLATQKSYLRPNTVETLTGESLAANWGEGQPFFHIEQTEGSSFEATLVLKGGGCENVGIQYSLPDKSIGAGRDIRGIKKCILDAAYQAQGKGCAPGILGVGIGGDRASSYLLSKEQFLRRLDSINPNPVLQEMETELYEKANQLGIGPMGYSGNTTLLGVLIGAQTRIPASYFVSVSYMCWTFRRRTLTILGDKVAYV